MDGSEPGGYEGSDNGGYIERAIEAGEMPFLADMLKTGTYRLADDAMPSFTNPNNISVVTGRPPAVHGICGNFFYDRDNDTEVMMNDPSFLRAPTLFEAFQRAGAKVAVVTAKEKLRRLLGHGLTYGAGGAICFSAEKASEATLAENGIEDVPERLERPEPASVYSAELSEYVFVAGVDILKKERPDIMYLSTTDFLQHKCAPGEPEANDFYRMMDRYFAQLHEDGATLGLVADHGMKSKHDADGNANVIYLQSILDEWLGKDQARVILPITDPYVAHHGALGGFATAYLPDDVNHDDIVARLTDLDGIECVLKRADACEQLELPEDRIGDIVIISEGPVALGSTLERHDLSGLNGPLRSHGGLSEQRVPFILNRTLTGVPESRRLRNFDIFDVALNNVA
jgi:phosphonoacetate hydrolase